jgi:transposase
MKSRGPYRRRSTPFKLQLCQDIRNGVIGRRDAQRTYGVSANLIQLWLTQFDRGELNDEEAEASVIAEYEAHIAALKRKVGQLTMELDLMKKTPRQPIAGDSGNSSIVTGPRPALPDGGANDRSPEKQPLLSINFESFEPWGCGTRCNHRRYPRRTALRRIPTRSTRASAKRSLGRLQACRPRYAGQRPRDQRSQAVCSHDG